jgi:hypothetical protein
MTCGKSPRGSHAAPVSVPSRVLQPRAFRRGHAGGERQPGLPARKMRAYGGHGRCAMANKPPRRPKPWLEISRQGLSRYAWRFQGKKHWTPFYEDPEEARADATSQITDQLNGKWQDKTGSALLLEEWIDAWKRTIDVGRRPKRSTSTSDRVPHTA